MPTTNKEREIRIAQRRVEGFAQQFGEAHRNLARHIKSVGTAMI
jgi:hypothetical protein